MTRVFTVPELKKYIAERGINAQLIEHVGDTPTVPAAAAALGVEPDRIIKTLLFQIKQAGNSGNDRRQSDGPVPETREEPQPESRVVAEDGQMHAQEATVQSAVGIVVISCGENRVERKLLARHLGVGQKRVRLAAPDTVLALLGYPAGGVPPFGHRTPMPVLLDEKVTALSAEEGGTIYGGGGDDKTMLKLTVQELLRITQPTVVRLSD